MGLLLCVVVFIAVVCTETELPFRLFMRRELERIIHVCCSRNRKDKKSGPECIRYLSGIAARPPGYVA